MPDIRDIDVKILATDVDPNVLNIGNAGIYSDSQTRTIPRNLREKYFSSVEGNGELLFQANQKIRDLVSFRELNLLKPWPVSGKFDAIFCRNTVIYFDENVQLGLWPRFQKTLKKEGWLFVGHSERIPESSNTDFKKLGLTTYRRTPK